MVDVSDVVACLTVQAPWAQMIATGDKTIENRRWRTAYRGPLVIHSGKTFDPAGIELALLNDVWPPSPKDCAWGHIAVTWLHDMHHANDCPAHESSDPEHECARWGMPDQWHWVLRDTIAFPEPIDGGGKQQLFAPPTRVRRLALDLLGLGGGRG